MIGIDAVGDGVTKKRQPMKYQWGLIGLLQQQLAEDVEHNGKHKKREEPPSDNCS